MKKTNFDQYLEEQLSDPAFATRFEHAGEARDVALQITPLRQQAGLSQTGMRGSVYIPHEINPLFSENREKQGKKSMVPDSPCS